MKSSPKIHKVALILFIFVGAALYPAGSAALDQKHPEQSSYDPVQGLEVSIFNFEESSLRYSEDPPAPAPRPVIPPRPLTPKELKPIIDFLQWIFDSWTWQQILDRFDTDRDGKLSGEELRRFIQALIPCGGWLQISCENRDALIDKYLKEFLCGSISTCDPNEKKISLDDFITWLDTLIRYYENILSRLNCSTGTEQQRADCERRKREIQDILEALKKLKETLRPPTPAATPAPATPKQQTEAAEAVSSSIVGW